MQDNTAADGRSSYVRRRVYILEKSFGIAL